MGEFYDIKAKIFRQIEVVSKFTTNKGYHGNKALWKIDFIKNV